MLAQAGEGADGRRAPAARPPRGPGGRRGRRPPPARRATGPPRRSAPSARRAAGSGGGGAGAGGGRDARAPRYGRHSRPCGSPCWSTTRRARVRAAPTPPTRIAAALRGGGADVEVHDVRDVCGPDGDPTAVLASRPERVVVAGGDGSVGRGRRPGRPARRAPRRRADGHGERLRPGARRAPRRRGRRRAGRPAGPGRRPVDVARAGDRPFVNAASAGLSVLAARHAHDLKPRLGPVAYAVGAAARRRHRAAGARPRARRRRRRRSPATRGRSSSPGPGPSAAAPSSSRPTRPTAGSTSPSCGPARGPRSCGAPGACGAAGSPARTASCTRAAAGWSRSTARRRSTSTARSLRLDPRALRDRRRGRWRSPSRETALPARRPGPRRPLRLARRAGRARGRLVRLGVAAPPPRAGRGLRAARRGARGRLRRLPARRRGADRRARDARQRGRAARQRRPDLPRLPGDDRRRPAQPEPPDLRLLARRHRPRGRGGALRARARRGRGQRAARLGRDAEDGGRAARRALRRRRPRVALPPAASPTRCGG